MRETQTRPLIDDIKSGTLDAALLALPVEESDIDLIALFEDLFLLAVPPAIHGLRRRGSQLGKSIRAG